MRRTVAFVVLVSASAALAHCRQSGKLPAHDPELNVLLITIDTLRADALGSYGNPRASTPWLDRLAAGGVRFEHAHAHTVLTLPSHASILSGVYPQDHGVRDNAGFRFPASRPTLATLLKARGYATGAFISAFPLDSRFGLTGGFDVYEDAFVDATPRPPMLEQQRRGTGTVALARKWLDAHAGQRTFCWVHLYEPHAPYTPPEPFASRFPGDPYAGEVAAADAALEPLLRPILDQGDAARTLVLVTGDHGESLGEHGEATHGVFAYEPTLRIPLIVYAPTILPPRVDSTQAEHVDVLPTVLDALDIPRPEHLRGRSLIGTANGTPDAAGYFESLSPTLTRGWAPLRGMIKGNLKYIDLPLPELYDLASDPRETHNLFDVRPQDAHELIRLLSAAGTAAPDASRVAESADARARLESLGYASGNLSLRSRYSAKDDPKRLIALDAALQEAVRLYSSGDRAHALEIAQGLALQRPDMRAAWMTLAQIQRDTGKLEGAIASLRRAHALSPHDAETLALLGAYLTEKGAAADAIAVLAPAAKADEPELQLLVALALAQARGGRSTDAIATLERARSLYPRSAMLLVDLGTVELMANHRDEARRAFDGALAQNHDLARAHSSLAAMDAEDGRTDDAVAEWREATRIDSGEYGRIYGLGVSFARAGRIGPARTCLGYFADAAPSPEYATQIANARRWLSEARR